MITEAYVSFEIAKLLKEKGFNEDCEHYYTPEGEFKRWCPNGLVSHINNEGCETWWWKCIAPTQQMAMRWLREVHNLNVEPYATAPGFRFQINKAGNIKVGDISGGTSVYDSNFDGPNDGGAWDAYEDAVEAAIKYCLTNLI